MESSNKAQIFLSDAELRQQFEFTFRRQGEKVVKDQEKLHNKLAHAQDIISLN